MKFWKIKLEDDSFVSYRFRTEHDAECYIYESGLYDENREYEIIEISEPHKYSDNIATSELTTLVLVLLLGLIIGYFASTVVHDHIQGDLLNEMESLQLRIDNQEQVINQLQDDVIECESGQSH